VGEERSFAWRTWGMVIGCLEMEGTACPLGMRTPSTCTWRSSAGATCPCPPPGSPLCFRHSSVLGRDSGWLPSAIAAMGLATGKMHGGGSDLEVQTVLPLDPADVTFCFKRPGLYLYTNMVRARFHERRFNKHWEAHHVWGRRCRLCWTSTVVLYQWRQRLQRQFCQLHQNTSTLGTYSQLCCGG
jgi:hypothetical protein